LQKKQKTHKVITRYSSNEMTTTVTSMTTQQCKRCGYEASRKYLSRHLKCKRVCKPNLADVEREMQSKELDRQKKTYISDEELDEDDKNENINNFAGNFMGNMGNMENMGMDNMGMANMGMANMGMANMANMGMAAGDINTTNTTSTEDLHIKATTCEHCKKKFKENKDLLVHYSKQKVCKISALESHNVVLCNRVKELETILGAFNAANFGNFEDTDDCNMSAKNKLKNKKNVTSNTTNTTTNTHQTNNNVNFILNIFKEEELIYIQEKLLREMEGVPNVSPLQINYIPSREYIKREDRVKVGNRIINKSDLEAIEDTIIYSQKSGRKFP
jgi:predicted Zn-ribbon and HTH transcriptional regulator